MKKYLIPIIGTTAFVIFVTYATVATNQKQDQDLLNENNQTETGTELNYDEMSVNPILQQDQEIIVPKKVETTTVIPIKTTPVIQTSIVQAPIIEESPMVIEEPAPVQRVDDDKYDNDYEDEDEENDD